MPEGAETDFEVAAGILGCLLGFLSGPAFRILFSRTSPAFIRICPAASNCSWPLFLVLLRVYFLPFAGLHFSLGSVLTCFG